MMTTEHGFSLKSSFTKILCKPNIPLLCHDKGPFTYDVSNPPFLANLIQPLKVS